ncbi:MAG TPA: ATP-binding protein [Aggregatilineales bacterium]|nr:ATP-binding protein [Aggregatilineales bacterium]
MNGTPIVGLFATSPGDLLYFLWVIVFSQAALLLALEQRLRGRVERGAGRYLVAASAIMACWIVLMGAAWIVVLANKPPNLIVPPLNRATNLLVILVLGWAFLTADSQASRETARASRPISLATGALALGIVGAYAYSAIQWYNGTAPSLLTVAWTVGGTALSAGGLLLLLLRFRVTIDAPLKLVVFALFLVGYAYTAYVLLTTSAVGDDLGAIRLAFFVAIPLFPVVVYRLIVGRFGTILEERTTQARQLLQSVQSAAAAPAIDATSERESVTLLKALGLMLQHEDPLDLPRQIAVAVAEVLKADVTALLALDDPEYADVIAAYDNIRQVSIAAMALKLDEQPTLREALAEKAQLRLAGDAHLNEMVDLYTRLDIQKLGTAYFQPLVRDGTAIGVLLVALPYTQRELRSNETQLLEAMAPIASRLLNLSRAAQRAQTGQEQREVEAIVSGGGVQSEPPISAARAEMQTSLGVARFQINELSNKVRELQIELDYERGRLAELGANDPEGLSVTQRLARMTSERSLLEAEREKLVQALRDASTQLATVSGDEEHVYGTVVRTLQRERDDLQSQKAQLESELAEIRSAGTAPAPAILRDLLSNLSEEKARVALERDQIKAQLNQVEADLRAAGIEGGATDLSSTIVQLTEERSIYKTLAERALQERDTLIADRQRLGDQIANEAQRDSQIAASQTDLQRLAEDNEVLRRQRDSLRQERDTYLNDRERWEAQRTRMVADLGAIQADLEEAIFERHRLETDQHKLAEERASLVTGRDQLLAERTALQTERDQLLARVEGNRDMLQRLGADGVGALKKMIDDLTEERSELEHRIIRYEREIATQQEALNKAKAQIAHSIPLPANTTVDASQAEVMLSIAQELRTPMSSIGGYVDLLMSESVGILGESQRKFLQRVKANSERAHTLIEDFVRVTMIDTGQLKLKPEELDMVEVIDDAITATRTQFREKGITLRMDLARNLPPLRADCDAIQQIVIQLLSNAYLASPTDGEVKITARYQPDFPLDNGSQAAPVVFMSVRDMGGGIPIEEQNRVFSRLYRADNPLIQGLGDTGVGLSIARALTEAHGGRIWLESVPGVSSTFNLVLPVNRTKRE